MYDELAFSKEIMVRIWDNDEGERVEIAPDLDGQGMVQIRVFNDKDDEIPLRAMNRQKARIFAETLLWYLKQTEDV